MYEYLVEKGVPESRIIVDNFGNTTKATAVNFRKLNLKVNSILVVSQYYHISRAKLALKNAGFKKVHGVHAEYFETRDPYSIVREFAGYYKYLMN